ncbi:nuclease-related domain-containing protein [Bacillus sp. Marseille-Q3570]|uniref:nuclease-related domain-containing protein n=1 Tax=Bacillus sp. Marseille-Q3570 TaxID=2963522 RepID=UPI0021B7531E|nr:nuclease-related domain-containing protein [Bacillus sp. Marseille-Q3570]
MTQKIHFINQKHEKLEAMERRTPFTHPARLKVESSVDISRSGEWGERRLDFYISFLHKNNYLIIEGLRLSSGTYHFQIDTLLVHPTFILIFEVKNLTGNLIFDTDYNQLIQQFDDREVIHKDPIQQVNLQHFQLSEWLNHYDFSKNIPILSFVVIVNDNARILPMNNHDLLTKKVIRNTKIRDVLNEFHATYDKEILSRKDLQTLKNLFLKLHTPNNPDLLSKLNIKKEELITGVQCPGCSRFPMRRHYGKWHCLECNAVSKNAHILSLRDYFLLFHPAITNRQLRQFLHVSSDSVAKKIAHSLNLTHTGSTKDRIYHLGSLWPKNYR